MKYMQLMQNLLIVSNFIGIFSITGSFAQQNSSIVVYSAKEIVTLESDQPTVKAVAIQGERIVAVGSI